MAGARLLPLQQHVEEMAENLIGAGKIAGARRGILPFGDQGRQMCDRWPSLFLSDVQRANDQADRALQPTGRRGNALRQQHVRLRLMVEALYGGQHRHAAVGMAKTVLRQLQQAQAAQIGAVEGLAFTARAGEMGDARGNAGGHFPHAIVG